MSAVPVKNYYTILGVSVTAMRSGGYNDIVKFYVDNGADLSKKNKQGRTAAELIESAKNYNRKYYYRLF